MPGCIEKLGEYIGNDQVSAKLEKVTVPDARGIEQT